MSTRSGDIGRERRWLGLDGAHCSQNQRYGNDKSNAVSVMKIKKTTLIATEIYESLSVRVNVQRARVLCEECEAEMPLYTPEEAAPLVGLSVRALNRLVEHGAIHFKETPEGLLLVCLDSIGRRVGY